MTTKKTDLFLFCFTFFMYVLITGCGWHRLFTWDQREGGINIFFSGKANGSNRKHLRTGDRNRSDCIAVTDNVAQACRLQEVAAIYGRKALKGRGGKFHPNNVPAGWTHTQQLNNSPKQHTHTHKMHIFPLRMADWLPFFLIFILSL